MSEVEDKKTPETVPAVEAESKEQTEEEIIEDGMFL